MGDRLTSDGRALLISMVGRRPGIGAHCVIAKRFASTRAGLLARQFQSVTGVAALTGSRSAEARGATWGEFDLEARIWIRPAERMKMRETHAVPLSEPALAILAKVKAARLQLSGGNPVKPADLVFPGKGGRPLADMTLLKAHKLEAPGTSVHGWRSTFASWAAAETVYPAEVRELSLAHVGTDKVARAYQRDYLLEKRRALMADWAAYLVPVTPGLAEGGNVVAMPRKAGGKA